MVNEVRQYMKYGVPTVTPETSLKDASRRLARSPAGVVAVVDRGRLVGTLTSADLLLEASLGGRGHDPRVADVMPADVLYCFEDTDRDEAEELMRRNHLDRLVVLDRRGRVVGAVTRSSMSTTA